MSVIVAGMEMPEYCYDCPCHNSENGQCKITKDYESMKRPFDCPLKSVEGLIEKIKEYNEFRRDEIDEMYMNDILKIIKEYCEMEGS